MSTKRCPFCAEEVQLEAVKCKHCGSMIGAAQQPAGFGPQPQGGQSYWDGAQRDMRPANQPNFAAPLTSRADEATWAGKNGGYLALAGFGGLVLGAIAKPLAVLGLLVVAGVLGAWKFGRSSDGSSPVARVRGWVEGRRPWLVVSLACAAAGAFVSLLIPARAFESRTSSHPAQGAAAPAVEPTSRSEPTIEEHGARICGGPRDPNAYVVVETKRADLGAGRRAMVRAVVRDGLSREDLSRASCHAAFDSYAEAARSGERLRAVKAWVYVPCTDIDNAATAATVDLGRWQVDDHKVELDNMQVRTDLSESYFKATPTAAARASWASSEAKALLAEGRSMEALRNTDDPSKLERCGKMMRDLQPRARALGACSSMDMHAPELTRFRGAAPALEMCVSCGRGAPDSTLSAAAACGRAEEALKLAR